MSRILVSLSKKLRVYKYKISKYLEDKKGLDTLKYVDVKDLGFSNTIGYRYEGSSKKIVKKVLKELNINSNDRIIDMGCGKGSALIGFSKFPFKRITGLEISNQLMEICKNNFKILKINNVDLINTNALDFKDYNNYNYIYFYNPFPESTFQVVLDNLIKTTINESRDSIYIIYKNPTCHQLVMNSGYFDLFRQFQFKNIAYPHLDCIYVYKSKYPNE